MEIGHDGYHRSGVGDRLRIHGYIGDCCAGANDSAYRRSSIASGDEVGRPTDPIA